MAHRFVGIDISKPPFNNLTPLSLSSLPIPSLSLSSSLLSLEAMKEQLQAQAQSLKLAFQAKRRKTHKKFPIFNQTHKSSSFTFRRLRRRTRRKPTHIVKNDGEDSGEKEIVEGKIRALQSIVPGGESLGVDKLFEQTADYIMALQYQVKAMKALSSFFEKLDKEKSECG